MDIRDQCDVPQCNRGPKNQNVDRNRSFSLKNNLFEFVDLKKTLTSVGPLVTLLNAQR